MVWIEMVIGQPLDGINNLGATWAGTNVAVGAVEDKSLPMDLLEVELANGQKFISFLGVTIGLIADCDIGNYILAKIEEINYIFEIILLGSQLHIGRSSSLVTHSSILYTVRI